MELSEVVGKLFELHQLDSRKAELVLEIAQKYALDRSSDRARDLSLHVHDRHQGHFDIEHDLRWRHEEDERLEQVRAEYRSVCEQIKSLEVELSEHFGLTPASR